MDSLFLPSGAFGIVRRIPGAFCWRGHPRRDNGKRREMRRALKTPAPRPFFVILGPSLFCLIFFLFLPAAQNLKQLVSAGTGLLLPFGKGRRAWPATGVSVDTCPRARANGKGGIPPSRIQNQNSPSMV